MTISLIFCLGVVLLLVGCVAVLLLTMKQIQRRQSDMEVRIQQMYEMNAKLRANRHDYLNNMQIVYGMLELNEYEELHAYLEPMYKDMMKTSKALKTAIPAVNALLMAKMSEAEKSGIDFYIEVKSNLKNMKVSDWDLCRVLANLIDNAFRAVQDEMESENRGKWNVEKNRMKQTPFKVLVDITENPHSYIFTVTDNGAAIPDKRKNEIFKQGFTTKKEAGHGMGLYIVSRIVDRNKGKLSLYTEHGEKRFEIIFDKPKELDSEKGA